MRCENLRRDVDAYIDGELEAGAAQAIHDHLDGCAACRRLVGEREALGRLVRGMPYYPAPDRLRHKVSTGAPRSHSVRRLVTWAAAATLLIGMGSAIGLLRLTAPRVDLMADGIVDGHVRSLMVDHLLDVQSTDQHTVKPWFLGKVDFTPPVVDLAPIGYPLVGGRVDYLGGRPVAALVYQRQKHTINVFVTAERSDVSTPAYVRTIRGFHVHHWSRDGLSIWAISDLNDGELTEFVRRLQLP